MSYTSTNPLFRSLDDEEEAEFRQWARDNFNPVADTVLPAIWHPIVVQECNKMVEEYQERLTDSKFG